jgi:hypothetical protein
MTTIDTDLKKLNLTFLMVARECARHTPIEAIWKFNLDHAQVMRISSMSIDDLQSLAGGGRAVFTIIPTEAATKNNSTTPASVVASLATATSHPL